MWDLNNLTVTIDFTTYCNARCPQCHRNNNEDLRKVDWLPLMHWTLDDFKKAFPEDIIAVIRTYTFVPTWGDALMNPYIIDIIKYILGIKQDAIINIETNGSMHDENWWFYFSSLSKHLNVTFDVDGINQEMHETYRVGTKLDKVLTNMKIFSEGIGNTQAQTIVFKHNQDYLEQIKQLCFENGSKIHKSIVSDRFNSTGKSSYFDSYSGKTIILEKASTKQFDENGIIAKLNSNEDFSENITCTWGKSNTIYIGFDGSVHPCCYIYNPYMRQNKWEQFDNSIPIKFYTENKDDLNVFSTRLDKIINNKYFKSILPETFKDKDIAVNQCIKHCSKNGKNTQIKRLIATG